MRPTRRQRLTQRPSGRKQVILTRELIRAAWPHPIGEWTGTVDHDPCMTSTPSGGWKSKRPDSIVGLRTISSSFTVMR